MDLAYQKEDECMLHDTAILALDISRDGEMLASGSADGCLRIWKLESGKCLRQFEHAHSAAISCIKFSQSSTQVLTGSHDSLCREFGLRASKMIKEFQGNTSHVNMCMYLEEYATSKQSIVTAGADGTVRLWNARTSEVTQVIRPGMNLRRDAMIEKSIIYIAHLLDPQDSFVVVPLGPIAYLLSRENGEILLTYESDKEEGGDFVSAVINPTNKWLYCVTEDHSCLCFDVFTGKVQSQIGGIGQNVKVVTHHPHYGIIASCGMEPTSGSEKKRGVVKILK